MYGPSLAAALRSYGLQVCVSQSLTLDPLRESESAPRRVYQAVGHAGRSRPARDDGGLGGTSKLSKKRRGMKISRRRRSEDAEDLKTPKI